MSTELKLLAPLGLTAGALAAAHGTVAQTAPSVLAVVDRTFFCTRVAPSTVNVWASSPIDPAFFKGYLAVTSGPDTERPLLYVRQRSFDGAGYPVEPGVFATRIGSPGCFTSRRSVPLSSAGLPCPPVRWEQTMKCRVDGGVLVWVRAVVQSSGAWLRVNPLYRGWGVVTRASLAVRNARTGRPLAFITIDPRSKLRVWAAPVCG